jgi:hypothetical protein
VFKREDKEIGRKGRERRNGGKRARRYSSTLKPKNNKTKTQTHFEKTRTVLLFSPSLE